MKNLIWIILALLLLSASIAAQDTKTDEQNKKEVSKLAFIVGDWKGDGWMMGRDRQKHAFTQTENIRFKLDSTAILIEGRGMNNGEIIHNALAVITYDKEKGHIISIHSWLTVVKVHSKQNYGITSSTGIPWKTYGT